MVLPNFCALLPYRLFPQSCMSRKYSLGLFCCWKSLVLPFHPSYPSHYFHRHWNWSSVCRMFPSWVVLAFIIFHLVELTVTLLHVSRLSGELNMMLSWTELKPTATMPGQSLPHIIVNMYLPHLIICEIGSLNDALKAQIKVYTETDSNNPWSYGLSLPHIIVNTYLPHLIILEIGSLKDALEAQIKVYAKTDSNNPQSVPSSHNCQHVFAPSDHPWDRELEWHPWGLNQGVHWDWQQQWFEEGTDHSSRDCCNYVRKGQTIAPGIVAVSLSIHLDLELWSVPSSHNCQHVFAPSDHPWDRNLNDALEARIKAYTNGGLPWPQNQNRHNEAHLQGTFCFTQKHSDDFPVRGSLSLAVAASARCNMLSDKVIQSLHINSRLNEQELTMLRKRQGAWAWTVGSIEQVEGD